MRRRIIIVTLTILLVLGIGSAMLRTLRNPGPPPVVYGNFSPTDISQIQHAVRHELWRDTFPNFTLQTFKMFPTRVRAAFTNRVVYIGGDRGSNMAEALWGKDLQYGYVLTNGPSGWRYQMPFFYIVPD
jgi:hypothetical protein